ncbi:MAG: SMP-30/gluconolactonase/LRE family protein [Phycisphaerales bacterium]
MLSILPAIIAGVALQQSPRVPDSIVDLRTGNGARLVNATWRYSDARIVDVDHRAAGSDRTPSGPPNRTHDIEPKAGARDFDDSSWTVVAPEDLESRRTDGRLAFGWYRCTLTLPEKLGGVDVCGASVWFEVVADDYAEVWVDGTIAPVLGQSGGSLVAGWNAPNRVLVARQAVPGQIVHIAVFAANGPLSSPPPNYVWLRSATLDVYASDHATPPAAPLVIRRADDALDDVIRPDATLEKLADGFGFCEGPVWVPQTKSLLFSDPNQNVIHRLAPDGAVSIYRTKSGYAGPDIGEYRQPGSNGLALDPEGRLLMCEHGNRRVSRLEPNGAVTVLADRFEGKRLNSPNDIVCRSDGAIFFTDPPFGLPKVYDDPRKELRHEGVYCLKDGKLALVSADLRGPNGIALSPDESKLYVANWDESRKIVMRYDLASDGSLSNGVVFFDMTSAPGAEALDGMKIDVRGDVFVSGPGGVWIISPAGKHLGTLECPELPANMAWGDDGRSLYLAARTGLYRVRTFVPGFTPTPRPSTDGRLSRTAMSDRRATSSW